MFVAGGSDPIIWPVTWNPEHTEQLKFSVKLDTADAVARIYLSQEIGVRATLDGPYYVIILGWNGDVNGELKELPRGCLGPQDETWTDLDGPSWIQYDLFRKNNYRGPKR